MNSKKNIKINFHDENLNSLSYNELKIYSGGGWITEGIAWLLGAWEVHSSRIQMTTEEREAFIKEHGLRDHY